MTTIVGAGAVGLALGARLARAGERVHFRTRRPEAAAQLSAGGVRAEDPATGESWRAEVNADSTRGRLPLPALAADDDPVILCVRAPQVHDLAESLAGRCVVSFQNGVATEAQLAGLASRVIGGVWRQTCTRVADDLVRFTGTPRVVVGLHPEGGCEQVETLAGRLRDAGFDVGASERIGEDKWLKLCVNLMSAPNALVRRADHTLPAFVDLKVRLLEEAQRVLAAAGITARSCDGRDRSLEAEIRHQRESLARGTSARRIPIYNQVWASLRRGNPSEVEAEGYHGLVIDLARRHGLAVPGNERVLRFLLSTREAGTGPESVSAAELLGD